MRIGFSSLVLTNSFNLKLSICEFRYQSESICRTDSNEHPDVSVLKSVFKYVKLDQHQLTNDFNKVKNYFIFDSNERQSLQSIQKTEQNRQSEIQNYKISEKPAHLRASESKMIKARIYK